MITETFDINLSFQTLNDALSNWTLIGHRIVIILLGIYKEKYK